MSLMLIRLIRATIVPVWFIAFGLLALLWLPMTGASGMLLLSVGIAGPAVVLILLSVMLDKSPLSRVPKIRRRSSGA